MVSKCSVAQKSVAIYIRWSTDEQTDGTTLETQHERCALYIRSQGWEVREDLVFVDDGYSGGNLDRPALTRLRQAVKEGKVDTIVAYSIDRLSRNVADIVQLVQTEWVGRAVFRSASQPISTDEGNPTGQLVFNILASFAEFERSLIRERTYSGSIRRAKEGKVPGGPVAPYGYVRNGKGSLAIDEEKAPIVRQIFEMATEGPYGKGPPMISRALNEAGVPAPKGGKWWAYSVREILRNPIYAGVVTYGRRKSNPAHQRDKSQPVRTKRETPLVRVEGAAPAIISREVWDRAQKAEEKRAATYSKKSVQRAGSALLTGLAICRCGGPLHIFYKGPRRYYRCSRNAQGIGCEHQPGIYRAEELEELVVGEVMVRYGTPALREGALRLAEERNSVDFRREQLTAALREVSGRIKTIEGHLVRIRKAALAGEIQLATYEELKAEGEADLSGLEERRKDLETALSQLTTNTTSVESWQRIMGRLELWCGLDTTQQREVLFGLLRQVKAFRPRGSQEPVRVGIEWEESVAQ